MRRMIFHMPLPLQDNPVSASGFRPIQMIRAFRACGYEVIDITGYGVERRSKIQELKKRLKEGETIDFLYSESSTQPTLLTEKHHIPIFPFLDFGLFKLCKLHNIKIGLFYRDIHWRFPFYNNSTSKLKAIVAKIFYNYDIVRYRELVDILFLPSTEMMSFLPPMNNMLIENLPPGHGIDKPNPRFNLNEKLHLIYVGGMGDIYQLHELFKFAGNSGVKITVSTRKENWDTVKHTYPFNNKIKPCSLFGEELVQAYRESHIGLLFVKPVEYWTFAMPYKLFEYIGYGIPIIASEGTLSAKIVEKYDIGWVISYKSEELETLLRRLAKNNDEIELKRINLSAIRDKESWEARALKVINKLA